MKTTHLTQDEMAPRIARFKNLEPLPTQSDGAVPLAAKDLIYARTLLSVIGLDGAKTPINMNAPIKGAGGMTMVHALCPPGQGPELHSHKQTFETFTVLSGTFEVRWNDDGDERTVLEQFDTISVPPGVCRAFRNVGGTDAILQVIISGGVHDMQDIDFSAPIADKLAAVSPDALAYFEKVGFTFTAGADAPA